MNTSEAQGAVAVTLPTIVGIVGGGTMGLGIAQLFASNGATVSVVERDTDAADHARARIVGGSAAIRVQEGAAITSAATARISVSTDYAALSSAQLVIEAVPEAISLKMAALSRAEAELADDAWLVTNTSSLPVSTLATPLARPERFCGLHFFNPVPRSALVELVVTDATSDELRVAAMGWIESLGKASIVVRDSPGFASSRLGNALALEAMRMLEEGVASADDIDKAMVLGYRHASGPLRTTDLVGLDIRLGVADYLAATLGERFAAPRILRDKVAAGDLGRKTGRGFYDYGSTETSARGKASSAH